MITLLVDYRFSSGAPDPKKVYDLFAQYHVLRPNGVRASFSQHHALQAKPWAASAVRRA